jgi:hypothetical protein
MIAKEKGVLVDSLHEQEGRQARARFQLVGGEIEAPTRKAVEQHLLVCAKRARPGKVG